MSPQHFIGTVSAALLTAGFLTLVRGVNLGCNDNVYREIHCGNARRGRRTNGRRRLLDLHVQLDDRPRHRRACRRRLQGNMHLPPGVGLAFGHHRNCRVPRVSA
jgi:hypothetical protein